MVMEFVILPLIAILFSLQSVAAGYDNYLNESHALIALNAEFNNSFLLGNWTGFHCYTKWYGIQCDNDRVTGISLQGMALTGEINLDALTYLPQLTNLSFKSNFISGNLMNFSSNQNLKYIDLSGNEFSGSISTSLLNLHLLESLQLQDNNLTGTIPEFDQSSLRVFNVSNNNLKGPIPKTQTLQSFDGDSYSNNPQLCGVPTSNPCSLSKNDSSGSKGKSSNFGAMLAVINVIGLFVVIVLFTLYFRKAKKLEEMMKSEEENKGEEERNNQESTKNETVNGRVVAAAAVPEQKGRLVFMTDDTGFDLNDLLKASAEGLGKGIFGNSYKAKLEGRAPVVVKRLRDLKPLSNEEFTKQLQIIADQRHPNLVPLLAYYYSKEEKLMVFKYATNGNLFDRIHGKKNKDRIPFRWNSRLSVARGVARALEYLHFNTRSQSSVIVPHGNLKSSNILLDENEMVLLSDYGLASLVALPIAAQRMVAYKSPEYQSSKKISRKSDVWSYGSLLLELLTGRIPVYSAQSGINGVDLCSWVHRAVREEWTAEIFDPEISVQRSAAPGMLKMLQTAIRCCDKSPEKRPEMSELVRELENIHVVESEDEDDLSADVSLTDEISTPSNSNSR